MLKFSEYSFCKKTRRLLFGRESILQVREADGSLLTGTEFKAESIYKSTPYTFMEKEGKTVLYTSVNYRLSHTGFFIFHCPSSVLFSITLHTVTSDFGSHITVFLWLLDLQPSNHNNLLTSL
jgi:hypothetical protein